VLCIMPLRQVRYSMCLAASGVIPVVILLARCCTVSVAVAAENLPMNYIIGGHVYCADVKATYFYFPSNFWQDGRIKLLEILKCAQVTNDGNSVVLGSCTILF